MAMSSVPFTSKSGHVEAVQYDSDTQELVVTFRGSRDYTYEGVTENEVAQLSSSESAGKFIDGFIKPLHSYH